ncbi:GNAT family N-acetyltransferase [Arthrobacter sp. GCM10027362]|uniref:GNAT family N-acetyltransferase n=1 Tax=Arthrobacter sp. GCM10027362 TaxID=3273379 RepID=UPI0036356479
MAVTRSVEAAGLDPGEVLNLYNSVGWSAYTDNPAVLAAALAGSSLVVEAGLGTKLVGLARVISNGASICYLQDILVHPDHRRDGIGHALAAEAMTRYAHVRQKVLLTDGEPVQKAFDESLGLRETADFRNGSLRAFVRFGRPDDGGSGTSGTATGGGTTTTPGHDVEAGHPRPGDAAR